MHHRATDCKERPMFGLAGHFGLREFESQSDWRVQPDFVKLRCCVGGCLL